MIGVKDFKYDWLQILAIITACVSSLGLGMSWGWTSQAIPKMTDDKKNYDISLEEASYLTVIAPLSMALCCIAFVKLPDLIGRKKTILVVALPQVIAWILTATATSIYQFYVARIIAGMADGILFISLPSYIGEIATPKVRGTWGNAFVVSLLLGNLLVNVFGTFENISTAAYISLAVPMLLLTTFTFMPESPYYYIMKNKNEDARKALKRLRRRSNIDEELKALEKDVSRQLSEAGTWAELLTIASNRKAIYAGVFLRVSQQLSGISCLVAYSQYIFSKAGGSILASTSTIILCSLLTVLHGAASFILDNFGRRKVYFYSALLCGFNLLLLTIYLFLDQVTEIDVSIFSWFPLAALVLYSIIYSFGLGTIPTLMMGELYSASIKGKALCILTMSFGISIAIVTKIFQLMEANIGLYSPFLMFTISCFVTTFLSLYFVPETKGKTLEEIQQSLKCTRK